ncbi:MAG: pentapeptide repeat-containing protein [Planctomycetota bacterium]
MGSKKLNVRSECIAGSEFEDVNLSEARFTNINLSGSHFHDINFSDVHFSAAQMGGTVFQHIGRPPDKDGKQERQRPVTFEEAMLCDSVFRKVDMSGVRIIDCNTEGMTIDGVLVTELLRAYKARKGEQRGKSSNR